MRETPARAPAALERAYAALEHVIYEATTSAKPMVSASTLRMRLVDALGSFNERELGFPRFKDFLLSAQNAGIIRMETRGHVTWIGPQNGHRPETAAATEDEAVEP